MSNDNIQITYTNGYDTDRLRFSEPESGCIPDSKPEIKYKRITLSTTYDDGTVGPVILPTEKLFSYGVQENTSQETGKVTGWSFPLCLYDRDGASEDQKGFVETFQAIIEKCKEHLVENREEIEQYDLEMPQLKKFGSCLYFKKELVKVNGRTVQKVVEGSGPTLYVKLIYSKKNAKFVTKFYEMLDVNSEDEAGEEVDPLTYLGSYCYAKSAIKIESIFIGNKISLQVKLYETNVCKSQSGMRRLLTRPAASSRVLSQKPKAGKVSAPMADDDDDTGSIVGSDNEESVVEKKIVKKKIKRRIVKKVVPK